MVPPERLVLVICVTHNQSSYKHIRHAQTLTYRYQHRKRLIDEYSTRQEIVSLKQNGTDSR